MNTLQTQLTEARTILHLLFEKQTTEDFARKLREHSWSAPQCPCTRARTLLKTEMPKELRREGSLLFSQMQELFENPKNFYLTPEKLLELCASVGIDFTSPSPPPAIAVVPTPSNAAQTMPAPTSDTSTPTPPLTEAPADTAASADRRSGTNDTSVISPATRAAKPKDVKKAAASSKKAARAPATSTAAPPSEPPPASPDSGADGNQTAQP